MNINKLHLGAIAIMACMAIGLSAQTLNKPIIQTHDVYFVFKGTNMQKHNLFKWDWWQLR